MEGGVLEPLPPQLLQSPLLTPTYFRSSLRGLVIEGEGNNNKGGGYKYNGFRDVVQRREMYRRFKDHRPADNPRLTPL